MGSELRAAGDPFETEGLRARVLAGWAASPSRFREDANAEEDYALGGYRDRLIVELAQNAADAASTAGVPGRLLVRLTDRELVVANTGAPIGRAGVESLSTLRASAKRTGRTVGRFGVGFAAVLAVTDAPAIGSVAGERTDGVRWSREETSRLASELPALAGELAARQGHVPVLRLPFPAAVEVPDGYDTAVVLPLREGPAASLALQLVRGIDAALLLALPALDQIVIETGGRPRLLTAERDRDTVAIEDDGSRTRWRVATASGVVAQRLLADRPAEERTRSTWEVTWAVPDFGHGSALPAGVPAVLHAPTPTDERLPWPALLIASFPLDPSRRRVAPGALADALLERSAEAFAGLVRDLAAEVPDPSLLALVPGPAAEGEFDARLRREVLRRLPDVPFLPAAADAEVRLSPGAAVIVEDAGDELVSALTSVLPGLLPAAWGRHAQTLTALGAREIRLADLVDELGTTSRDPARWRDLYDALGGADPEALGALPVPLADGRTVRGSRGLLLPGGDTDAEALAVLGLRVVHPRAAHPLLERLGARRADARAVLDDPLVRVAVESAWDRDGDAEGRQIVEAVLGLVRAADVHPGELPWLADLPLPDQEGDPAAAGDLMLPGGELAGLVEPGSLGLVDESVQKRWEPRVLEAVGVLRSFALVRDEDVLVDPFSTEHDLAEEAGWLAWLLDRMPARDMDGTPPVIAELVAVRDLDLVRADAWPAALALLAQPPLRDAVVQPAHLVGSGSGRLAVQSYTAWWLRRHVRLGGRRTVELRTADDARLAGLYDPVPYDGDPAFLHALGVRSTLPELLAEPGGPQQLVDRLGDPALPVGREQLRALLRELATVDPNEVTVPTHVRVPEGAGTRVVAADEVVVLDAPDLLPLAGDLPVVTAPAGVAVAVADVLGLQLASEAFEGQVRTEGVVRPVPQAVSGLIPALPAAWVEHDQLLAGGVEVEWRFTGGQVHAATTWGLACGLAWAAGRWPARHLLAAALGDPEGLERSWYEADLEPFEP